MWLAQIERLFRRHHSNRLLPLQDAGRSRFHLEIDGLSVYDDGDHDFGRGKHGVQVIQVETGVR